MSDVGAAAGHRPGEAFERLRAKWASITAFGVLLVVPGFGRPVLLPDCDHRDGHAQRRPVPHRRRSRDRHRHARAQLGPVLPVGDRRAFYLAAGVICIVNPVLASVVLTLIILGVGLIAAGLVRIYLATELPVGQPRLLVFVAAAVIIPLGLIIVNRWPRSTASMCWELCSASG
jgi:hypothetical protein